VISCSFCGY